MDADWDEVSRVTLPPPPPPAPGVHPIPTPVATLAFDNVQDLLWAANGFGRVSSFYGADLQPYTSFRAHPSNEGPVHQLLFHGKGIIALGSKSIHMALRRGPPVWNIRHEKMTANRCMCFTSKPSELLIAGEQNSMFLVDINKGEVVKEIPTEHHYTIMKSGRYICAARQNGTVDILDNTKMTVVRSWNAHASGISDMDAQHDFIVTCGYSLRQGQYMLDSYVNVYDLKHLSSTSPIPFPPLAAYVRMHPRMLTTSIVFSQLGQMHVVDLMNPNTNNIRQANVLGFLKMVEMAPSGEAIAMADDQYNIHLWGSRSKIHFVDLPTPLETADTEETPPHVDWSPDVPLGTVGMPYYRDTLLSAWPSHLLSEVGAPPPKLDPAFLAGLKVTEHGMYGRNSRGLRRNQVEDTRSLGKLSGAFQGPKFLSEQAREADKASNFRAKPADSFYKLDEPFQAELKSLEKDVPKMYEPPPIRFSRFGIDDFDFKHYNKTRYAGLENHIANAYANALIQLMHFTPIIRNAALRHAATACLDERCMLCELGYVFDMLQKAEEPNCQATNLLKTLRKHPSASNLNLLEEEHQTSTNTPNSMLQGLSRFLMHQIVHEYNAAMPESSVLEEALATSGTNCIKCMYCRSETNRSSSTYVNDLMYPSPKAVKGVKGPRTTFSQILKMSIEREVTSNKGWCSRCTRYQSLATRRTIHTVPSVLVLNSSVTSLDHKRLWAHPGWLPEEIGIIVDHDQVFCYEGEDLKLHLQRGIHNITVYSLIGVAANIEDSQTRRSHLVAFTNVAHAEPTAPAESQWHLFNDFLVRPVPAEEALTFNTTWKTPSVLFYQMKKANNQIDVGWKEKLDTSVLYKDFFPTAVEKSYRSLDSSEERPGPNTIVAIDTEFVSVGDSEISITSDRKEETIRPIAYALARVSTVRAEGEDAELPFIDDYIAVNEPIVDYLTRYSGIEVGDLDQRTSKHNLVPLKTTYKRLWLLVNLGCKFLGHGLKQDFRVINIQVPKTQVIDTAQLFVLDGRRKLSLSFLAWCLLQEDIQQKTHDSIEDARTALRLYRKYLEFHDAGVWQTMLQEIYVKGRATNFKVPRPENEVVERTDTPPIPLDGAIAPSTPAQRPSGSVHGSGDRLGPPLRWTPGRGSPLR